jgi:hypothetical protein
MSRYSRRAFTCALLSFYIRDITINIYETLGPICNVQPPRSHLRVTWWNCLFSDLKPVSADIISDIRFLHEVTKSCEENMFLEMLYAVTAVLRSLTRTFAPASHRYRKGIVMMMMMMSYSSRFKSNWLNYSTYYFVAHI